MTSRDGGEYTTNEEDLREAARLRDRLRNEAGRSNKDDDRGQHHTTTNTKGEQCVHVPSVKIAEGKHKYVQIRAKTLEGKEQTFVTSRRGAHYHRDAAEPFVAELERAGYRDIDVTGGGRILLDNNEKTMSIFGFSYGFGKADHEVSMRVCQQDPLYKDYNISFSDSGY